MEKRLSAFAPPYGNCNRLDIVRCGLPVWFCIPVDSSQERARSRQTVQSVVVSMAYLACSFGFHGFPRGSAIGDLKHSLFTAILILLSYVASILIVREKSHGPA